MKKMICVLFIVGVVAIFPYVLNQDCVNAGCNTLRKYLSCR